MMPGLLTFLVERDLPAGSVSGSIVYGRLGAAFEHGAPLHHPRLGGVGLRSAHHHPENGQSGVSAAPTDSLKWSAGHPVYAEWA